MMNAEQPSVHDGLLTGYEVDGRVRTIVMHIEPHSGGGEAFVDVTFRGVAAYQFQGDALSNIIFGIEAASPADYDEIACVVAEQQRVHGVMGDWKPAAETLQQHCDKAKLRLFIIQSSYGLDGWVIAAEVGRAVVGADGRR